MSNYVLVHHGIKGQKWGVRRFQNPDGTLTTAGRKRYEKAIIKEVKKDRTKDKNDYFMDFDLRRTGDRLNEAGLSAGKMLDKETAAKLFRSSVNAQGKLDDAMIAFGEESKAYSKTKEFKDEMNRRLEKEFGSGCDDSEAFEIAKYRNATELFYEMDHAPKTKALLKEAEREADQYIKLADDASNKIIDKIGSKKLNKDEYARAEKIVVNQIVSRDFDGWVVSNIKDTGRIWVVYENDYLDFNPYEYSMDDYNKSHGQSRK